MRIRGDVRDTVGNDTGPEEWWQGVQRRHDTWWRNRPALDLWRRRTTAVVLWASALYLAACLLFWPTAHWALRAWVGVVWSVLCWCLLAHTRTLRVSTVLRFFTVAIAWSLGIGVVSTWLVTSVVGLSAVNDVAGSVAVASFTEEALKLVPVFVVAWAAPGRARRFAVADWLVLGFASGAAFEVVEEAIRRAYLMNARAGLLDFCQWTRDFSDRLDCYGVARFGLSPFRVGFSGEPPYAGHAVMTALVAVGVGVGVRLVAARWEARWVRPVAVLLPVVLFLVAVVDHAARNGSTDGTVFGQLGDAAWPVASLFHAVSGGGHGRVVVLAVLLGVALALDGSASFMTNCADAVVNRPVSWVERTYASARVAVDEAFTSKRKHGLDGGRGFAVWAVSSVVDVVYIVARDVMDVVRVLRGGVVGEFTGWRAAAVRAAAARDAIECARRAREVALGTLFDDSAAARRSVRVLGVVGVGLAAAVGCVVAPLLAGQLHEALSTPGGLWLAGILESIGGWWDDLPFAAKVAVLVGVGAAVALSGGTLGLTLGVAGTAFTALDEADTMGRFVRDPKGQTREYLERKGPMDIAFDASLLVVSSLLGGAVGAAPKASAVAWRRSGFKNSFRDHIGELPDALARSLSESAARTYSGVPVLPLKHWLEPLRRGAEWHRKEQQMLNELVGGVAELSVRKTRRTVNDSLADPPVLARGHRRLDYYDYHVYNIYSMKHTQLADIKYETAKKYIDELRTKYSPRTPISDVKSTPRHLRGEELRGKMILWVPQQDKPIPQSILDYARKRDVIIMQSNGKGASGVEQHHLRALEHTVSRN